MCVRMRVPTHVCVPVVAHVPVPVPIFVHVRVSCGVPHNISAIFNPVTRQMGMQ